jgi:hypothetical protein
VVEGVPRVTSRDDGRDNIIQMRQNITRRNAKNLKTKRCQMRIPSRVAFRPVPAIMRLAVNLNGQSPFETDEIQHEVTEGMLPAEFVLAGTLAEFSPDKHFRQVSGSALALGDFEGGGARCEHPSTTSLRPAVPLPGTGRYLARGTHQHEPPRHGEGDHAQHGGGVTSETRQSVPPHPSAH